VLVREFIQDLARRSTVIVTTHNMDEAERVADRVAIIDHGELLALDEPEALERSVGPGDVLEVTLDGDLEKALEVTEDLCDSGHLLGDIVILRARSIAEKLPALLARLEEAGFVAREMKLRQSSLEDVFISLTGRRLRE